MAVGRVYHVDNIGSWPMWQSTFASVRYIERLAYHVSIKIPDCVLRLISHTQFTREAKPARLAESRATVNCTLALNHLAFHGCIEALACVSNALPARTERQRGKRFEGGVS